MADNQDTSASLTKEDKEKIIAWVNEKLGDTAGLVCSVCQTRQWGVGDDLVAPPIFKDRKTQIGGVVYPQVMLICVNCAHTIYLNAVQIGIVRSAEEIKESVAEQKAEEVVEHDSGEAANG